MDYVTVVARHELGGRIRSAAYQLASGVPAKIDCVTDERQAASLKSGGQGTRYTCKVAVDEVQSDVYLFHDEELLVHGVDSGTGGGSGGGGTTSTTTQIAAGSEIVAE
jgi:hypothetical protein